MRVRLFHWKAEEAAPAIAELEKAGFTVDYEEKLSSFKSIRDSKPDAFVVDLSRLPAHGREVAIALRGNKATRHAPIVFVDGDVEKLETIRRALPDAIYTPRARLIAALRRARPLADPVRPAQMMERYAGRSAAQKLGVQAGMKVGVIDAPPDYGRVIGKLPEGATFEEDWGEENFGDRKLTLWFVHDFARLQGALPAMRRAAAHTRLWILWRKAKQDGLDGGVIRRGATELGLVDYKICSVNEVWSAMAFAIKKTPR
jgi:CheY-like chemotaxis protein